jgi:CubicO group peptidase (beta-lactamase class C family)
MNSPSTSPRDKSYARAFFSYMLKNKFAVTSDDYKILPKNLLEAHKQPFAFKESATPKTFSTIQYLSKGQPQQSEFSRFMEESGTTALLIIKDDEIQYENYFNGYEQNTPHKVFSITKSFTSALIGILVENGLIKSVNDPISNYIPELRVKNITIKHLLQMDAGISFKEGRFPWKDEAKIYLHPNARKLALNVKEEKTMNFFHYNDYHLLLLGILIERATGESITPFFYRSIWEPLHMQYPGFLTVDSEKHRFEKLESGLVMTAIDLAKFGRLFLHNGNWEGKQIISEKWIVESVGKGSVPTSLEHFRYYHTHPWGKMWFRRNQAYYKYLWWGYLNNDLTNDYFALGALGQVLYISPEKNAIAIRLGKKWGVMDWWPSILNKMIHEL